MSQRLNVDVLEDAIDIALGEAQTLSEEGLLPTPVLIQLHILSVRGDQFFRANRERYGATTINENVVATDAIVLTEWTERPHVLRQLSAHVCKHGDISVA